MSLLSQLLTKAQKVSSGIFLNGPIVVYSKESLKKLQYFGNCQLFCSGNDFVIPPCTLLQDYGMFERMFEPVESMGIDHIKWIKSSFLINTFETKETRTILH